VAQNQHIISFRPLRKGPQQVRIQEGHIAADDEGKLVRCCLQPGVQAPQHAHAAEAILDQRHAQARVWARIARHDQHLGAHASYALDDDLDQRAAVQLQEGLVAPAHAAAGATG
jgi:hypothetical protein